MPSKSDHRPMYEPCTSLLFKEGDRVRLKGNIFMPNVAKGQEGTVASIEFDDLYPVNVLFDKHLAYGEVPCWDAELELVAKSVPGSEPTNQG